MLTMGFIVIDFVIPPRILPAIGILKCINMSIILELLDCWRITSNTRYKERRNPLGVINTLPFYRFCSKCTYYWKSLGNSKQYEHYSNPHQHLHHKRVCRAVGLFDCQDGAILINFMYRLHNQVYIHSTQYGDYYLNPQPCEMDTDLLRLLN